MWSNHIILYWPYLHWYAAAGFCDAEEILTESGTTFYWPETIATETTTFTCPLGEGVTVDRSCGAGGVWGQFDEIGCGESISGQLNNLVDLFLNVKPTHIILLYSDFKSYLHIAIAYHWVLRNSCIKSIHNYWAIWNKCKRAEWSSIGHCCQLYYKTGIICGWL